MSLNEKPPRSGRRRVVHVTTTDISLELLLGPQLRAFTAAGYEVYGASAPGPHVAALEAAGIRHLPLRHATRAVRPHRDLAVLGELVRLFRSLRPDIVHTHNPKPGLYGRVAARVARVPAVVNTVHGLYATPDDPIGKRAVVYGLERAAAACSDVELVQNPEDVVVLRRLRIPERRIRLLGNGIDLDRFSRVRLDERRVRDVRGELGARPDDVLVGAVGRLVREKGYPELFQAAEAARARAPRARFVVVGPNDPAKGDALGRSELDAATRAGIVFAGMRDDIEACYAAFDLYALASHREGFPRSAMEAAAMGLPIVATDIRGCRQVVEHGVTGLLVPVRDPGALADALVRLVTDGSRRAAMGNAARAKAMSEFDQSRQIELTLEVYRELLARRTGIAESAA
jgi:glycosyltransferase involved in cell wall biosynthesis